MHPGLILVAALGHNPVVISHEPRPPSYWMETFQANCGRSPLVISAYGKSTLRGAKPKVTRDGRTLTGPGVGRLLADLSNGRAVYRFSVQCGRAGDITMTVYEGEAQPDDTVRYRASLAVIIGNRLDLYTGLEPSDADTFWWR